MIEARFSRVRRSGCGADSPSERGKRRSAPANAAGPAGRMANSHATVISLMENYLRTCNIVIILQLQPVFQPVFFIYGSIELQFGGMRI